MIGAGNVLVGSSAEVSSTVSYTTSVNPTYDYIAIRPGAIVGPNAADFAVASTTCNEINLASSGQATQCSISVRFTPTTVGAESATLPLSWSNTGGETGTQDVALSGTGLKGTTTLTWARPASISFGTSLGAMQLDAQSSAPGTFSYSPGAGVVLRPGVHVLTAIFTPTYPAAYSGGSITTTITVTIPRDCRPVTKKDGRPSAAGGRGCGLCGPTARQNRGHFDGRDAACQPRSHPGHKHRDGRHHDGAPQHHSRGARS